jgi:segregation and condensation protein B
MDALSKRGYIRTMREMQENTPENDQNGDLDAAGAADQPAPDEQPVSESESAGAESGQDLHAELRLAEPQDADADELSAEGEGGADAPESLPTDSAGEEVTTEQVIEAILFAADAALTLPKIVSILGVGSARDVKKHIESLNKRYAREGAVFRIEKIAGGYQMLTLPQYNNWLRRLRQNRQDSKLSPAALETLAVVAYKQPVVRAEIEAIRGVSAGEMLNRLRELNLVKIVGRAEDVGRPMLYGTTKRFLEVFGLSGLEDLPQVEQLPPPQ